MECTERMGNVQGARRRHLAGEERGIYPIRLRAFGQGVLIWTRNLKRDWLRYPDRDLRLANHHLCAADIARSGHARRRWSGKEQREEGKTSGKEE